MGMSSAGPVRMLAGRRPGASSCSADRPQCVSATLAHLVCRIGRRYNPERVSASVRLWPLAVVVGFFVLGNVGVAVCAAYSAAAPAGFLVLYWVGVAWGFSWWVVSDCRARGLPASIDDGSFVFWAWPVSVPYYVLKTRGFRGCGTLIALIATYLVTYLLSLGIFYLLAA
jgi:hypothetical protein